MKPEHVGSSPPQTVKHQFTTFPTLSNDQLLLRRIVPSNAGSIRDLSYYDGVPATSDQEALVILEKIEQDYARGDTVHWGICLQGSDAVVGTCGFYRGYPDNVGEIGYVLRETYRGRGIMTSALKLALAFGLEEMKLGGIVAYTDATNIASISVLERLGFRAVPSDLEGLKFSL